MLVLYPSAGRLGIRIVIAGKLGSKDGFLWLDKEHGDDAHEDQNDRKSYDVAGLDAATNDDDGHREIDGVA